MFNLTPFRFRTFFILLSFGLISCQNHKHIDRQFESEWPTAVTYEIFVQSFYDSNGDGIGDLKGVTLKLDYLSELGVKGIWLMPIMPSPTYHKYDITDYKNIHPDYGTLSDFKELVREAHKRGIQVVIDLVINHTSSEHPWFLEAGSGKDNPFREYYVWAKYDSIANQVQKNEVTTDSDNLHQWHPNHDDDEHYYGFFWKTMPDLNFDNQKVREEIFEIGRFWIEETGIDGFRLDAARHIYPDDRLEDSQAFWIEFRQEMEKVKPDIYLIGEVWDNKEHPEFLKGIPALFNLDLTQAITDALVKENGTGLIDLVMEVREQYTSVTDNFYDAILLRNHDQNRIMSDLNDHAGKAKLAASLLLTLPGTPYLYYGEELGMRGRKPDENIREPFLWQPAEQDQGRASWREIVYNFDGIVSPLSVQTEDPNSMYNHYKKMIHLRNQNDILTLGTIKGTKFHDPHLISFIRELENTRLLILHNLTSTTKSIDLHSYPEFRNVIFKTSKGVTLNQGKCEIPPFESVLISE